MASHAGRALACGDGPRRVARGEQLIEPRQLAAFRTVLDELTIADRFGVSLATVRRHLRRAPAKLEARSLIEGLACSSNGPPLSDRSDHVGSSGRIPSSIPRTCAGNLVSRAGSVMT